jgi:hypothetical protein
VLVSCSDSAVTITTNSTLLLGWDDRVPGCQMIAAPRPLRLRPHSGQHRTLLPAPALGPAGRRGLRAAPLCALHRLPGPRVWSHHRPSYFALPRSLTAHVVTAKQNDLTRYWRLDYHLVECPQERRDGAFVAEQAVRMLAPPRYVEMRGPDLLLQHLVGKLRQFDSPMTSFVGRHRTFDYHLRHLRSKNSPTVVETGCVRQAEKWTAGMSSYVFGLFLRHHGGRLVSVDLSAVNGAVARDWCHGLPVSVDEAHSHDFLRGCEEGEIDLPFLDSEDVGAYQECCAQETRLALPHLAEDGLLMIDDTPWRGHWQGKGALAVPWLEGQGFEVVFGGYPAATV